MKDQNHKKGFLLYADQMPIFNILEDNEAGKLIKHIFKYVNGVNTELNDRILKMSFEPIRNHLKRDLEKWESVISERRRAGAIGGLKSGEARRKKLQRNEANQSNEPSASILSGNHNNQSIEEDLVIKKLKQNEANEPVIENKMINEIVNEKVNGKERENESVIVNEKINEIVIEKVNGKERENESVIVNEKINEIVNENVNGKERENEPVIENGKINEIVIEKVNGTEKENVQEKESERAKIEKRQKWDEMFFSCEEITKKYRSNHLLSKSEKRDIYNILKRILDGMKEKNQKKTYAALLFNYETLMKYSPDDYKTRPLTFILENWIDFKAGVEANLPD